MFINCLNYLIWICTNPKQVKAGFITHQQADIHYRCYGLGLPVLLLHGGLSHPLSWFAQLAPLVAAGRQVIVIETRGHGKSTLGTAYLNYQLFADDALMVLDHLKVTRTDIVGFSDGGIIGLLLGLQAPALVDHLVVISANFNPAGLEFESSHSESIPPRFSLQALTIWLRHIWWFGSSRRRKMLATALLKLWRTEPQFEPHDLQAITAPTLVIAGEHDIIDPLHTQALQQQLHNAELAIIAGAGHAAPMTHAKQINGLIIAFLSSNKTH